MRAKQYFPNKEEQAIWNKKQRYSRILNKGYQSMTAKAEPGERITSNKLQAIVNINDIPNASTYQ